MTEEIRITALKERPDYNYYDVEITVAGVVIYKGPAQSVEFEHREVCPIMGVRRFVTKAVL